MSAPDPLNKDLLKSLMEQLFPILDDIRKGLKEHGVYVSDPLFSEPRHIASTSGAYKSSRKNGGQLGDLLHGIDPRYCYTGHNPTLANPANISRLYVEPDLVSMKFFTRVEINGRLYTNVVLEYFDYPQERKEWWKSLFLRALPFIRPPGKHRIMRATIQAVLEPLKVRVISKGQGVPYYWSKPLQVALHTVMRRMPCFRLIGAKLQSSDLIDLAMNPVLTGTGPLEWFSIDYSAATDKLSAKLSRAILDYLTEGADESIRSIWRGVLAPHMCEYPFPFNREVEPVQQVNGQLMGSILSFPILCLANLALYLVNIKSDPRSLTEKLSGVLVNGDDMLYVAPRSLWSSHVEIGGKVGLTMSPGKAYHHGTYANANSACYHFELARFRTTEIMVERRRNIKRKGYTACLTTYSYSRIVAPKSSTPWYIPFLNTGLYFGQGKVLGGSDEATSERSLVSVIDRLIDGALPGKGADLLAMYLKRHSAKIAAECKGRNLFIPQSLGGMGCTPPTGFESVHLTLAQRVYAGVLAYRSGFVTLSQSPHPSEHYGYRPDSGDNLNAPWLVGSGFIDSYELNRELSAADAADDFDSSEEDPNPRSSPSIDRDGEDKIYIFRHDNKIDGTKELKGISRRLECLMKPKHQTDLEEFLRSHPPLGRTELLFGATVSSMHLEKSFPLNSRNPWGPDFFERKARSNVGIFLTQVNGVVTAHQPDL